MVHQSGVELTTTLMSMMMMMVVEVGGHRQLDSSVKANALGNRRQQPALDIQHMCTSFHYHDRDPFWMQIIEHTIFLQRQTIGVQSAKFKLS